VTRFDANAVPFIDNLVHSVLVSKVHTQKQRQSGPGSAARAGSPDARRALVYERDPLTSERVRTLLASEGFAVCVTGDRALFDQLRRRLKFQLFVIGVADRRELEALETILDVAPLMVLAPRRMGPLRMALPDAAVLDRSLRDPDAVRRALDPDGELGPVGSRRDSEGQGEGEGEPDSEADPLRGAFSAFGLSERQLEVARLALLGETSAAIGARLFISEPTVRNHLHAIYDRVGVSGRRELLGRFVRVLVEDAG
jgi:DNA-binding CsgD family transcriptional regulator